MKFINEIKKRKTGLIIGAIAGGIIGYYFTPHELLSQLIQTNAIIDNFRTAGVPLLEWAKIKVTLAYSVVGAFVGFLINPKRWFKW